MTSVLVLQGIWAYGAVHLWAEDPALPAQAPPRTGRPSRAPRRHPFAVAAAELADVLAVLGAPTCDLARKAVDDELTLRLPTIGNGPLSSPELIRPHNPAEPPGEGSPTASARLSLAAWRVPVLTFEPDAAADLLAVLAGAQFAELTPGGSIGYLGTVPVFAADLAARGRVLPMLVPEEGGYAARWRPVLTAADAQRARELATAMPPACRAAEDAPAGVGLADMLDSFVDAAVRARLEAPLLAARRGRRPARIPYAERFLASLTAPDPLVPVQTPEDEAEAASLAASLAAWLSAAGAPAGSARTCFRLVEPEAADLPDTKADAGAVADTWRVEFALQSAEDPSLILAADDVWAGVGTGWLTGDEHPDELLLAGLGSAARLFSDLEEALREPAPARVTLDNAGALRFLRETGPLLADAGFGVLLPDWARKARLGLKLTAKSSSATVASARQSGFGMQDLVEFRYDLAVGDHVLSPGELAELAALKVPLVRVRGQWVELDERHLKAALKFLEGKQAGTMTAADVLQAGLDEPAEGMPVTVDADGWLGDLLSGQADRRLAPLGTPSGFRGELRPYQQRGLAWLSFLGELGLGAVLADDMGLGKTVQLLALVASDPPGSRPTLLVCPMSLVGNWQREAERFTPQLRVHVHHGAERLAGDGLAAAAADADLVITTYGVVNRDQKALGQEQWGRVVVDEAQAVKNHGTAQAKAVRALPSASRIALTGTPVENQLSELWSIMEFANPGLLGSAAKFRERFAVPVERNGNAEAAEQLRRVTRPFVLRRLKTDKSIISDLPDKQEIKVWCNLTQEQASLYQATVDDMLARIEESEGTVLSPGDDPRTPEMQRRGLVLATMAKLKQVCNHPAHLLGDGSRLPDRSGKLERLEETCEQIAADGDKALLFTQYAEWGRMLQPYLTARIGCQVLYLHGGTTKKQRDALVTRFQDADEPVIFLLSLKAGGTGLNLTAANHVIHIDRWWNPAVENQATDRAFRIGQRRNVQVRKFICVGTLEERIDAMIEQKKALAEQVIGAGENWLTELSTSELRSVVALSSEAIA